MRNMLRASAGLVLLLLQACSGNPPVLHDVRYQLTYNRHVGRDVYESLMVFVKADDLDGDGDLQRLYLIHDKSGLHWSATSDDWELRDVEGDLWRGIGAALGPDGEALPRGRYRVLVLDAGGFRDESSFNVDVPIVDGADLRFPTVVRDAHGVILSGPSSPLALSFYSTERDSLFHAWLVGELDVPARRHEAGEFAALLETQSAASVFFVAARDESRSILLSSGPYRMSDFIATDDR